MKLPDVKESKQRQRFSQESESARAVSKRGVKGIFQATAVGA